jgi:hypothetical protein
VEDITPLLANVSCLILLRLFVDFAQVKVTPTTVVSGVRPRSPSAGRSPCIIQTRSAMFFDTLVEPCARTMDHDRCTEAGTPGQTRKAVFDLVASAGGTLQKDPRADAGISGPTTDHIHS